MTHISYKVNVMVADDLMTQKNCEWAVMVLTYVTWTPFTNIVEL